MRQNLASSCTGECIPFQVSILNGFGGVGRGQRRQNALISCRKIIVRAFLTLTSLPCSKLNFLIQISGPTFYLSLVQSKFECVVCFCSFTLFSALSCFQDFGQYVGLWIFLGNAPIIVNPVREEGSAENRWGIEQGAKILVNFPKMGQHTFIKVVKIPHPAAIYQIKDKLCTCLK